jgi:hypothetical protein
MDELDLRIRNEGEAILDELGLSGDFWRLS